MSNSLSGMPRTGTKKAQVCLPAPSPVYALRNGLHVLIRPRDVFRRQSGGFLRDLPSELHVLNHRDTVRVIFQGRALGFCGDVAIREDFTETAAEGVDGQPFAAAPSADDFQPEALRRALGGMKSIPAQKGTRGVSQRPVLPQSTLKSHEKELP